MKLDCLVVDDEPVARKLMLEYIADVDFLELKGCVENALKAIGVLNSQPIDLIFLDINMPKLTGIEFLRVSDNLPAVILTTAYAEYAIDGFELDVLDYLVKPFSFERFLKACNKAREFLELRKTSAEPGKTNSAYFFVKCDNRIEKVMYNDLLAIEGSLNYITLHTVNGKLIVYHTLKGIADKLPGDRFLKVHKSFIVNLDRIKSIEGNEISLGNLKILISQNLHNKVLDTIIKDKMIKR